MAANAALNPVKAQALNPVKAEGWTAGLANLFSHEANGWKTRRGLIQIVFWILIVNGLMLAVLTNPTPPAESNGSSPAQQAVEVFCMMLGFICPVAIMVTTQSSIIGEKQSGTAAWILSKPVSRTAFILSKFLSTALNYLVCMVLLPGLVAYFLLASFGLSLQIGALLAGLGLLFLNMLFFHTFTLMMGTFVNSRRTVIGASLVLLIVLNQLTQMSFGSYLPGHLPADAIAVVASQPLLNLISLVETVGLSIAFIGLAFWRFGQEEF